jgi:hypothetical protein
MAYIKVNHRADSGSMRVIEIRQLRGLAGGKPLVVSSRCRRGSYQKGARAAENQRGKRDNKPNQFRVPLPQTRSMIPNRKAVVSPNSNHPFSASIAPISRQRSSRNRFECP